MLEARHRCGQRLKPAARAVEGALVRSGAAIPDSRGGALWRTIMHWREALSGFAENRRDKRRFERWATYLMPRPQPVDEERILRALAGPGTEESVLPPPPIRITDRGSFNAAGRSRRR